MQLDEARRNLKIDIHLLESEVATHSMLQEKVSTEYIFACSKRDEVKLILDQTIAMCGEDLRGQKDENGKFPSETKIASLLNNADDVVDARRTLNHCIETAELWRGVLDAYRSRSYLLRDLVSMNLATTPSQPPDTYSIGRKRLAISRETNKRSSTT